MGGQEPPHQRRRPATRRRACGTACRSGSPARFSSPVAGDSSGTRSQGGSGQPCRTRARPGIAPIPPSPRRKETSIPSPWRRGTAGTEKKAPWKHSWVRRRSRRMAEELREIEITLPSPGAVVRPGWRDDAVGHRAGPGTGLLPGVRGISLVLCRGEEPRQVVRLVVVRVVPMDAGERPRVSMVPAWPAFSTKNASRLNKPILHVVAGRVEDQDLREAIP